MIAWDSNTRPDGEVISSGTWEVIRVTHAARDLTLFQSITRHELQQPLPIRKGFRSPPLNPGRGSSP